MAAGAGTASCAAAGTCAPARGSSAVALDVGPGTLRDGIGSDGTSSDGTGSDGIGSDGIGAEGTGTEGTGAEDTGGAGTSAGALAGRGSRGRADSGRCPSRPEISFNASSAKSTSGVIEAGSGETDGRGRVAFALSKRPFGLERTDSRRRLDIISNHPP